MSPLSPKVFVTGVTGYVGGDALSIILAAHPDWSYVFYVRSAARISSLIAAYPSTSVRTVVGDLANTDLLTNESAAADIVLHFASSDDVPAIAAIVKGLGTSSSASATTPKYLIHTSGTGNLLFEDAATGNIGNAAGKVWDDIADLDAVHAWPDSVFHHPVERVVLDAHKSYPHLKTAIICPPAIVGIGRGPGNKSSMLGPVLTQLTIKRGRGFKLGAGKSVWSLVHVHDLSELFLRITEVAAAGGQGADWGYDGWYFAENGQREIGSMAERIAQRLYEKGKLASAEVDSISLEEGLQLAGEAGGPLVRASGMNSKSKATRTRKVLGWAPKLGDWDAYFDETVDYELEREA